MKTLDASLLEEAVRRIVSAVEPEAVYLYGSHAYGTPHDDSDVDLLVVVAAGDERLRGSSVAVHRALRGLFLPAEIKMVTRAGFERRALDELRGACRQGRRPVALWPGMRWRRG